MFTDLVLRRLLFVVRFLDTVCVTLFWAPMLTRRPAGICFSCRGPWLFVSTPINMVFQAPGREGVGKGGFLWKAIGLAGPAPR